VVLERDEGEVETGVAVEEEHEGEEDGRSRILGGGELTVSGLLGLVEVKLGVEAPPLLVLLVYTLTTDGQLDGGDRTLGGPARGRTSPQAARSSSWTYMSPTRSPLRATVTETRPESPGLPLRVCSMVSIAKLVWRLYFAW
jgi:hypothetical protein